MHCNTQNLSGTESTDTGSDTHLAHLYFVLSATLTAWTCPTTMEAMPSAAWAGVLTQQQHAGDEGDELEEVAPAPVQQHAGHLPHGPTQHAAHRVPAAAAAGARVPSLQIEDVGWVLDNSWYTLDYVRLLSSNMQCNTLPAYGCSGQGGRVAHRTGTRCRVSWIGVDNSGVCAETNTSAVSNPVLHSQRHTEIISYVLSGAR